MWTITIDQHTLFFAELERREFTSNEKLLSDAVAEGLKKAGLNYNVAGSYQITATGEPSE